MWDLEHTREPVYTAQAHASIINQIDGTGGQASCLVASTHHKIAVAARLSGFCHCPYCLLHVVQAVMQPKFIVPS